MDLISIIVPVYNNEKTIAKCLASLLAQSYTHLEIIAVDDGSTDTSAAILDDYARKNGNITVIHTQNRGVSAARNTGLHIAGGLFVGFADADDWAEKDMFFRLHQCIVQEAADVSVCGYWKDCGGKSENTCAKEQRRVFSAKEAYARALSSGGCIQGFVFNKLFRSSFFAPAGHSVRFDEELHICEDLLCVCRIFSRAEKIAVDPAPLYHYCVSSASATQGAYTARKATLMDAGRKIWEHTQESFPGLAGKAANRYITGVVYIALLALYDGGGWERVIQEKRRIKKLLPAYLFAKEASFKYKLFAAALCLNPSIAKKLRGFKKRR